MITVGIDVGSIGTKAAVIKDNEILATLVMATGYNVQKIGQEAFDQVLSEAGLDPSGVDRVIATGYGRNSVTNADKAVTEITCHAAGAHFLNPSIRSIIDIGGQDSKAIVVDDQGRVKDFAMNDKCAAGTGRFLEVMARAMDMGLETFGEKSLTHDKTVVISSLCTVFAESEVISLISKGENRANIIAGIHAAIGSRVVAMGNRIGLTQPVMMTGGVAKNVGVVKALEDKLNCRVHVSENAQVNGAIGAALIAAKTG